MGSFFCSNVYAIVIRASRPDSRHGKFITVFDQMKNAKLLYSIKQVFCAFVWSGLASEPKRCNLCSQKKGEQISEQWLFSFPPHPLPLFLTEVCWSRQLSLPNHQRWCAEWKLSRNTYKLHTRFLHVWHRFACSVGA